MNSDRINKEYINMVKGNESRYIEDSKKTMERVKKSDAKYRGKPTPTLYHPMFLTGEDLENLKYIGGKMMDISNKLTDRFVEDKEFRKKFGFPDFIERMIEVDNGYGVNIPIARFDLFYKDRDNFKFCEINTDGSSAMNEDNTLSRIILDSLALKDFGEGKDISYFELFHSWVEESIKLYKKTPGAREKPNVAIVDFKESGTSMEFIEFQKAYRQAGYNCEIVDPRDIEFKDGSIYEGD